MSHETESPMTPASAKTSMTPQQDWLLRSRELLERSTDELDASTLSRLNRARQAVLEDAPAPARLPRLLVFAGSAAVAVGLLLVVARGVLPGLNLDAVPAAPMTSAANDRVAPLVSQLPPMAPQPRTPVAEPDFDLLLDTEQLPLLEELEFYTWLDAETQQGG